MRALRRMTAGATVVMASVIVAGCGGDAIAEPLRSYSLAVEIADDEPGAYRYIALDPVDIRVGDEVTFTMDNTGSLAHDMHVYGADGEVASAAAAAPGGTTQLTVFFEAEGVYQLRCYTDDHLTAHQMFAEFDVLQPDDT